MVKARKDTTPKQEGEPLKMIDFDKKGFHEIPQFLFLLSIPPLVKVIERETESEGEGESFCFAHGSRLGCCYFQSGQVMMR